MIMNDAAAVFKNWEWLLRGGDIELCRVRMHIHCDFGIHRQHLLMDGTLAPQNTEGTLYETHPRMFLTPIYYGRCIRSQSGHQLLDVDACLPNIGRLVRGAGLILDFIEYNINTSVPSMTAAEVYQNEVGATVDMSSISMMHMYNIFRYGTRYPC